MNLTRRPTTVSRACSPLAGLKLNLLIPYLPMTGLHAMRSRVLPGKRFREMQEAAGKSGTENDGTLIDR